MITKQTQDKPKLTQEELLSLWSKAIEEQNKAYKKTHDKKEFTFSATESRHLIKNFSIETIAHQLVDDILNNVVLPRVGVAPSPEVKIIYDLSVGRFVVWTPKEKEAKQPSTSQQK